MVHVQVGGIGRMPMLRAANDGMITLEEVKVVVEEMKEGKAAGLDGCFTEYVKRRGEVVLELLVRLLNVCFFD